MSPKEEIYPNAGDKQDFKVQFGLITLNCVSPSHPQFTTPLYSLVIHCGL